MTTQYTSILKLALPVQGELSGTWGDVVNDNITSMIEEAIAGRSVINTWTANAHTLTTADGTTSESRAAMLEFTDTGAVLSGNAEVICPTASKIYIAKNAVGSSRTVTLKTSAGTGIAIPDGTTMLLFCDGTNVVEAVTNINSLSVGGYTVTLAGAVSTAAAFSTAGANALTLTTTGTTNVTLPTTGTLATLAGTETFTNKTLTSPDINGGSVDNATIGATTPSTGVFTNLTANTDLTLATGATVTGINTTTDMSDASTTTLATSDSIKQYVDAQVGANNELSEVLANGNMTDGTNIVVTAGDSITTDSILETTAAAGVDIDGILLKDTSVGTDDASGTDIAGTNVTLRGGAGTGTGAGGSLIFQTAPAGTTGSTPNAQVTALTIDSAGDATFTGASYNMSWDKSADSLIFADNAKAIFGAGGDLQIYHDGSNSYIKDLGTGDLFLSGNTGVQIQSDAGENMITTAANGAVSLFYDASAKLATTSTGVTISSTTSPVLLLDTTTAATSTAEIQMEGYRTIADVGRLGQLSFLNARDGDTQAKIEVYANGDTEGFFTFYSATNNILDLRHNVTVFNEGGNDSDFRVESNNNANMIFVDAGSDHVNIGTSSDFGGVLNVNGGGVFNETTILDPDTMDAGRIGIGTIADGGGFSAPGMGWGNTGGNTAAVVSTGGNIYIGTGDRVNANSLKTRVLINAGEAVFNDDSTDTDFRVESDANDHMLFVDASTDRVGINQSAPQTALHINNDTVTTSEMTLQGEYQSSGFTNSNTFNFRHGGSNRMRIQTTQYSAASDGFALAIEGINSTLTGWQSLIRAINTAGSFNAAVVINEDSSAEVDFRVESDTNTHALFVDAGNSRVGINNSAPNRALDVDSGTASDIATFQNDAGGYTFGYTTNLGSWDLGASDALRFRHGATETVRFKTTESVFNELGNDINFRVESDANAYMLYVDAQENVASLGVTSAAIPAWLTDNSVVVADNVYGFQGASYANACYNISVDNNYTYFLHNGYYAVGGWTQRLAGYGNAMYRLGQASHQWEVAADVGTDDTNITWRPIMNVSETNGFIWNENSYNTDFRVESDNNAYMFYVDAGLDAVGVGTQLGSSYQASQQGMLQMRNGGSEATPSGSGGIEFYAAQANNGYSHRLCAFDNSGGDTPLLLQRRNNSATWSTQVTFEGANNNVVFAGTVSKGGGSFKIDHPLPSMNSTHHLVHSFIEGPQADNLYRGRVSLVAGQASVNLDAASNMTEGTFVLLNRDIQCFTSNETGWTPVKGTVTGNTLLIEAQDNTCTDTISWMVVGERQDQFMYDNEFADEDGHIIVEPLKKPNQQGS